MAYPPCNPKLGPLSSANWPRAPEMLLHLLLSPIWEQEARAVQQADIVSKIQISEGALAKRHTNQAIFNSPFLSMVTLFKSYEALNLKILRKSKKNVTYLAIQGTSLGATIPCTLFRRTLLRYVRLMAWAIRLSVCLSSVTLLHPRHRLLLRET